MKVRLLILLSITIMLGSCCPKYKTTKTTVLKKVEFKTDPVEVSFKPRIFSKDTLHYLKDSVRVRLLIHHDTVKHLDVYCPPQRDTVEIPCDEIVNVEEVPRGKIRWWHLLLAVIGTAVVARIMR